MSKSTTTLFDNAMRVPYQRHSVTSRSAARQMRQPAVSLRQHVLAFMQQRGEQGATDEEIFAGLLESKTISEHTKDSTVRARRIELTQAGKLRDSGNERRTRSGATAVVWVYCGGAT